MFYINQRYTNIRPGSYMAGFGKLNLAYHISMHYIYILLIHDILFISSFAKSNGVGVTAGSQVASVSGITAAAKDSAERIGSGIVSGVSGVVSAVSGVVSAVSRVVSAVSRVESAVSRVESAVSGVESAVSGVVSAVSTLTASARIAGHNVSRVISAVSGVVSAVSTLTTSARIAGNDVSRVVSAISRVISTVSTISSQTGVVVIPIIVSAVSIIVSAVVSAALVAVGLGGGAGLKGPELVEPGGSLEVGAGAAVLHVAPLGTLVRRFAVSVDAAVFVLEGGDVALAAAVGTPGRSAQPNILLLGRFQGQTSPNAHSQNEKLHFYFFKML